MRPPLIALLVAALVASGASVPAAAAPAAPKPLIYCTDASPEGFDPGLWDSASTNNVNNQMFQGLVRFERGGTALQPGLATRWTISPDARSFVFELRPGVKFHTRPWFTPTRHFNADDVLFTFGRFLDRDHPFNKAFPANFIYPQNLGLAKAIARMEKVDDMTVRFTLHQANVTFVSWFAMAFAGIQSAEYGAQLLREGKASQINRLPIGTGPFAFRSYAKDDVVRMEANPDYWGSPQRTRKLIFSISREAPVRVQKLLAGECQITSPLRDIDVAALDRHPDRLKLEKIQALNISYLSFNLRKPPTDNRLVREALDIAIDRDAIFRALFPRGDAMQAVNPFPPAIPGYHRHLRNEYNPDRAKALLLQAGFPNGLDIDLWALPVTRPTNPNGQLMAQLIQQDWARIGVRAQIRTYEWGEYLKRANAGEHSVYMSGWSGENGDADDFLTPNLSCATNTTGVKFCHRDFERLIDAARANPDPAARQALYEQAQEIFKRERPWITMAHSTVYIPTSRDLRGFRMQPNGGVIFENVYRE
ncbi:ABC transporter substrate-binding protein [Roseateles amylovorans]|uniref:ABC transporter substrate-binding protein n=1 Tax=Roseateles amylovorans TaxID=2978473 RepID=A0ABY6B160_9BURK|nr:ABC transporter substrate-binding protein [Roseateles amylovorans]UXH78677.1 ABC transporter substrate-binding protein [Roseateles amylovorans]